MAHRPNILKLATKISLESLTYTGITYNDPEYRILEPIVSDDMCEVMMHMRLETPRTAEDIARRAKKSVEFTQTQLDKLVTCGVIRATVASLYGKKAARELTIQYGGSMNEKNAAELLAKENVDGGLIGGASLKPAAFAAIVSAANKKA